MHLSEIVTEYSTLEGKLLDMAEDSKKKDFLRGMQVNEVDL